MFAGATALLCIWDLITLKLAWLPLPYFPGPDEVFGGMIDDRWLLLVSTLHSLRLLFCGYIGGVIAGLISGVLIGWFAVLVSLFVGGTFGGLAGVATAVALDRREKAPPV